MPAPPFSRQAGVSSWFETGAGRGLLQLERRLALEALQTRPSQPWLWLTPTADMPARELLQGRGLRLHRSAGRFAGDARCALPFPLPTESLQAIVAQHAVVGGAADFLAECERLLMPGGRLWLFTLNPMSPYRFRWARRGPVALRPDRWRLLAQRAGLHSVQAERYLGPIWRPSGESTDPGRAPWRAVYLLEVEKRAAAAIGPTPIALPARWPQPVSTI
ncbi:class I SAM-dependent methyltransferase [Xanthomonas campestris pv. paulliniae]|uniref:class I SAM-dependent methyltransferase n=1 Tax=Xanthomonas euvesicatoria TaxID=456327 RepID=UPI001C46D838|nr:class I SAM-dependent methyltransferase [Xanthomonas euvesicatoria]MBV6844423.1 class I SAM-dependent methyltransferase [Xanthomonas campestris pv. paulliniae]